MGDGKTHAKQDMRIEEIEKELSSLETKFSKNPSPEIAETLKTEYSFYLRMRTGYFHCPNVKEANQRISELEKYLSNH